MNKLIDSQFNFSVVTEDSLMQAYTLNASQAGTEQVLMTLPSHLYVLQAPQNTSLEDALVAERSGEDLLLSFRSDEQAHPALKFDQFFANNGRLHVLKQDGELLRAVMAQDNPQPGPVILNLQAPSAAEQQVISPLLGLLLPASESTSDSDVAVELAPLSTDPAAPVQLAALNVTPLSVEPPQITHVLDQIGARQGTLTSGNVTDDRYATIEGTGTPGDYLEILDNDEVIGETRVGSDGRWSFEPEQAYSEAGHILTARVTGTGESSAFFVLVVDTIAPSRTYIDSISDDRASGQTIDRNGHTSDSTPVIKGRAEAFNMVAIYSGKSLIGTSFADASGNWTFSSIFIMPDGEYTISSNALDFSGNTGLSSTSYKFTIDTLPPAVPSIDQVIDDFGSVQGALQSGAVTDDTRPTFTGKGEAGTVVSIYDNGHKLGEVRADQNGSWSFTPLEALTLGEHSFNVQAQDLAGNQSGMSQPWEVIVNSTPPEKPGSEGSNTQISEILDDHGLIQGLIEEGGITDDRTPTLNGTGDAGDTIIILDKGEKIGEALVNEQGKWTFTPKTELGDGEHAISVVIRNQAGNESEPSDALQFTVDTQAFAAPVIGSVYDDVGTITGELVSGAITDDARPSFSGKSEAGTVVSIYDNGHKLGEVQADENGNWSFTPEDPLAEGEHSFTVTNEDRAGNLSEPSDPYVVIIDLTPPNQSATITSIGKDSGPDSGDWLTNDGSAGRLMMGTLSSPLAADEKLQLSTDGGLTWVDAFVNDTHWSTQDNNSHDQSWTIHTRTVDSAGQIGKVSSQDVILDNLAPKAPVSFSVNDHKVTVTFDKKDVEAGDRISLVNGEHRQDYLLTEEDIAAGLVTLTPSIPVSNDLRVGIVDKVNNVSDYASPLERSEIGFKLSGAVNVGRTIGEIVFSDVSGRVWGYGGYTEIASGSVAKLTMPENTLAFTINLTNVVGSASQSSQSLVIYDTAGNQIGEPIKSTLNDKIHDVSFTAPAGVIIGAIEIHGGGIGERVLINKIAYEKCELSPSDDFQMIVENGGMYGGGDDTTFVMGTSVLPDDVYVSGGGGVDQLKLIGSGQLLDFSSMNGKISSVEVFDITGTGNNTLKLSLGDLLENGSKNLFLPNDNVQLMVKGDAGDKVVLDDLLPNGSDPGDWTAAGTINLDGVAYNTYQHSAMNAELLVQAGVSVELT